MKPRPVKGLDPAATLADSAERILRVRLDELYDLGAKIEDPAKVRALHDMRIAAKRLRYLLELTGFCFGAEAPAAAKVAKELQEVLGDIHDCDMMLPLVSEHVADLRSEDVTALVAHAMPRAHDLEPGQAALGPNRALYRGLDVLSAYLTARREVLYRRFLRRWRELERERFRERLDQALAQRAGHAAVIATTSPPEPASRR